MHDSLGFWEALLPPSKEGEDSKRREYCKDVVEVIKTNNPALYNGEPSLHLSEEESRNLVAAVRKSCKLHTLKPRMEFLIEGLRKGALEFGWDVSIPSMPVIVYREKPRLDQKSFDELGTFHNIREIFLRNLSAPPPSSARRRMGQLLISAILFGGLLNKMWLLPWVEALRKPNKTGSLLWLDLALTQKHFELNRRRQTDGDDHRVGEGNDETDQKSSRKADFEDPLATRRLTRRWFADPLTHTLIVRLHREYPEDLVADKAASPTVAIRDYLQDVTKEKYTKTFAYSLIKSSATSFGLRAPPYLLAYAEARLKSVSLPAIAWERLLTGRLPRPTPGPGTAGVSPTTPWVRPLHLIPRSAARVVSATQEDLYAQVVRSILPPDGPVRRTRHGAYSALEQLLDEKASSMCPSLGLAARWAMDLLTEYPKEELLPGRVKSRIRPSSVKRYLDAFVKRLVAVAGNDQILTLDREELHDLYSEVIGSCTSMGQKHTAGKRLFGFHNFLIAAFGAPPIDFGDLFVEGSTPEASVDANVLSPQSFDHLKVALAPPGVERTRRRTIQLLLGILGFRCGLRRSEALKLRLMDVQEGPKPELLVRNNRYAYVKSGAAVRRIPLHALLEQEELELLLGWKAEQVTVIRKPDALLFCNPMKPEIPLEQGEVFPDIEAGIRQVTGDPSLRFHHLRHSFATWLILRLLGDFTRSERQSIHFLAHPCFSQESCERLRDHILGNMGMGRKALYAAAQLCGHGSPGTTLLSYMHLADFLLGIVTNRMENEPHLSAKTLEAITGLKPNVIYYHGDKDAWFASTYLNKLKGLEDAINWRRLAPLDTSYVEERDDISSADTNETWLTLRKVEVVIQEWQRGTFTAEELAKRCRSDEGDVKRWCANAERLREQTRHGYRRHVNTATLKSHPEPPFPTRPHLRADADMANSILERFAHGSPEQKAIIVRKARLFASIFSVIDGAASFDTVESIRSFVQFLSSIAIPTSQIRVILSLQDPLRRHSTVSQLSQTLNLPAECFSCKDVDESKAPRIGTYFLKVLNSVPTRYAEPSASYGFRYAMYLILIAHGHLR